MDNQDMENINDKLTKVGDFLEDLYLNFDDQISKMKEANIHIVTNTQIIHKLTEALRHYRDSIEENF